MSFDQLPPPEHILITRFLRERENRGPNHAAEADILGKLSLVLANTPDDILATISDEVMRITNADSAGISLAEIEDGHDILRWRATSGVVKPLLNGTMPRDFSPCGVVLQINSCQLMKKPADYYQYIEGLGLNMEEILLAPFHRNGVPCGTVWAIHHKKDKQFDNEDGRIIKSIARFTGAASTILQARAIAREAQDQLITTINHRDEFLSLASHELKTPLSSLLLQSQMFLKAVENPKAPDLIQKSKNLAETAAFQSLKLSRLVDGMLEVSNLKHGSLTFQKEPVDLDVLVRDVVMRLDDHFVTKPTIEYCNDGKAILDRRRIEQVIQNLLINAINYGQGKAIKIEVTCDEYVVGFSITDYGVGIAPKHHSDIFKRFYRDNSEKNDIRGFGLGLYSAQEIVTGHSGKIWVESEPGQGSTFFVELPRKDLTQSINSTI